MLRQGDCRREFPSLRGALAAVDQAVEKIAASRIQLNQSLESMVRFAAALGFETHPVVTYEALLLTVVTGEQFRTKVGYRVPATAAMPQVDSRYGRSSFVTRSRLTVKRTVGLH
jgi:hypothetical protein